MSLAAFFAPFQTCARRQRKFVDEVIDKGIPEEPDPSKQDYVRLVSTCTQESGTTTKIWYYPWETNSFIWRQWYAAHHECLFGQNRDIDLIQTREGNCVYQLEHVYWYPAAGRWLRPGTPEHRW